MNAHNDRDRLFGMIAERTGLIDSGAATQGNHLDADVCQAIETLVSWHLKQHSGRVAETLGWRLLDSGALYRAVGYAAGAEGLDLSDVEAVTRCAQETRIRFHAAVDGSDTRVVVNGHDATDELRTETAGAAASAIASIPSVRQALVDMQLAFRKAPGLVGYNVLTVVDRCAQGHQYRHPSRPALRRWPSRRKKRRACAN